MLAKALKMQLMKARNEVSEDIQLSLGSQSHEVAKVELLFHKELLKLVLKFLCIDQFAKVVFCEYP